MAKTKIVFVIPSLGSGGMERVMSELVTYFFKKEGVECYLILYGKTREIFYDIPKNTGVYKPNFEFNDRNRSWMTLKTMVFLRKTIKRINPDVVLSFGEVWNNLVLLSLRGLKYPVFISDRCTPEKKFSTFHNYLRKWLYPKAKGIIAQTEKAKQLYKTQFKNKNVQVIGNPIRSIVKNEPIDREKIVISIGRLIDTKHFDRLIQIFKNADSPIWKLIIIGGDAIKQKNRDKLQKMINAEGLQKRVLLEGTQSNVDEYLLRASIFAFTSSSEGFPNVIGEAMSAGLPVIAYDCVAGPAEMIQDGKNGYLIPLFEDELFREKLVYLMSHSEERTSMGLYAKESIQKYSIDIIGQRYYDLMFKKLVEPIETNI